MKSKIKEACRNCAIRCRCNVNDPDICETNKHHREILAANKAKREAIMELVNKRRGLVS